MNKMSVPVSDLTGSFWIGMGTMVFAFFGICLKYAYKSKCKEVACCCVRIVRDTQEEIKEDLAEIAAQPSKGETSVTEPRTPVTPKEAPKLPVMKRL